MPDLVQGYEKAPRFVQGAGFLGARWTRALRRVVAVARPRLTGEIREISDMAKKPPAKGPMSPPRVPGKGVGGAPNRHVPALPKTPATRKSGQMPAKKK